MRLGRVTALVLAVWAGAAFAQNDLRIGRLGNPTVSAGAAGEATGNFQAFSKAFAAALTSVNLTPPETLGHAAWSMTVELGVVNLPGVTPTPDGNGDGVPDNAIDRNRQFYFPTAQSFSGASPLLVPSLHFRKGLPFSFELGTRVAWIDKSSTFAGTFEAKWAVNEGFAFLPDIGMRLYATRAFNIRDTELGAGGFDVGIGKQFAVGGMITLTPYAGWNLVFVGAKARKPLDFDPDRVIDETDTLQDLVGPQAMGSYGELKMFDKGSAQNRFYLGTRFIGGIIQLGAELSYTALGSLDVETTRGAEEWALPGITAMSFTLGLDY